VPLIRNFQTPAAEKVFISEAFPKLQFWESSLKIRRFTRLKA
jgi:hypothetical protein